MSKLLLAFCAIFIVATEGFAQSLSVEKPDLKIGDSWTYRTINLMNDQETMRYQQTITEVSDTEIKLDDYVISSSNTSNAGKTFKKRADKDTWTFYDTRVKDGKQIAFVFPLVIGNEWKYDFTWNTSRTSESAKVEGEETITVPAGTFKTIKIVHNGFYNYTWNGSPYSARIEETYWYAPEIKRFVKREYLDRNQWGGNMTKHELVEFKVN